MMQGAQQRAESRGLVQSSKFEAATIETAADNSRDSTDAYLPNFNVNLRNRLACTETV